MSTKGIGMIRDYFGALHRVLRQTKQAVRDVLFGLIERMEKAGGKCHRYEKKMVFDILGVAYERRQKTLAA